MKLDYNNYKSVLFSSLLHVDYHDKFVELIDQLYNQGNSKKQIYKLFLEFFNDMQKDPRTKDNDSLYDKLTEFMDGFTYLGKSFKILPNESDV